MRQLITLIERELAKHQIETSYTQLKKGDFFLYSGQVSRHIAYIKSGFMRTYREAAEQARLCVDVPCG